jgi:hypothetical protein
MTKIDELRNALSAASCKLAEDTCAEKDAAVLAADQAVVDAAYNALAVFIQQTGGGYVLDGTTAIVYLPGVNYGPPTFTVAPYEPLP